MNNFEDKHCVINVFHYANMFTNKFLSVHLKSIFQEQDWNQWLAPRKRVSKSVVNSFACS